jgi:hypothetical protein
MTMDSPSRSQLPRVLVNLFRGIVYREQSAERWRDLIGLQAVARDYVRVLGLELIIDEAEGYAFLRQLDAESAADTGVTGETATPEETETLPRLIARRQLSYQVSLLLVQLRKRLAQHDALGGDTRLVLTREQIVDMTRTFLPASTNDAKLTDQIARQIERVEELGFLRKTKEDGDSYEVRRILRAFVNADWLAELEAVYRTHAEQLD